MHLKSYLVARGWTKQTWGQYHEGDVAELDGLPEGHKRVAVYGGGVRKPIKVKNGDLQGWLVGGGKRRHVEGNTFHPQSQAPHTFRWGFWPIAIYLDATIANPALLTYYKSLPQNATRPGGELIEMKITQTKAPSKHSGASSPTATIASFYFVSDNYTAFEMSRVISKKCKKRFSISDPILFNSTGNIHMGNVVQYYRGDSAAMILEGYDNTKALSGKHHLKQNPPLPSTVDLKNWDCLNKTIRKSIPLMSTKPISTGEITGIALAAIACFILVVVWGVWLKGERGSRNATFRRRLHTVRVKLCDVFTPGYNPVRARG